MNFSKLMYISQGNTNGEHLKNIQEVLDAGCTWIQLRMKDFDLLEIEKTAEAVKIVCDKYKAVFIINDKVEIAKNVNTHGVHLGLTDMSIPDARKILGINKIIGGTANTLEDVLARIYEKCNYIGLGPFRHTETKKNLSPILGTEGYNNIMSQLDTQQLKTPIYAIGGILLSDVESILDTNVFGIAVSGSMTNNENKKVLVDQFNSILYAAT